LTERSPAHPLLAETPGELVSQGGVLGAESGDLVLRVIETLPQGCGGRALHRWIRRGRWSVAAEPDDGVPEIGLVVEPAAGDAGDASDGGEREWFGVSFERIDGGTCPAEGTVVARRGCPNQMMGVVGASHLASPSIASRAGMMWSRLACT
jgi:hypothetical protein